ncbi:MAG: baseplate J/gp47 family protein [Deltaproteobacteria bacterium]
MYQTHDEGRAHRADQLDANNLNGLYLAFVSITPPSSMAEATVRLQFFTTHHVAAMVATANADPAGPHAVFQIYGGTRRVAGPAPGSVRVESVMQTAPNEVELIVRPVGDYSTYTLTIDHAGIDPIFAELDFKFRPGCFRTNCAPDWDPGAAAVPAPHVDFLARDFDSFRHLLVNAMSARVPRWSPTSEADLTQVLMDLSAGAGDRIADLQDRVLQEAYWATAKKRVSIARHARLVDYHVHEGHWARAWMVVEAAGVATLPAGAVFRPREGADGADIAFTTLEDQALLPAANAMRIHRWSDAVRGLEAGSTEADLALPSQPDAIAVRDRIRAGTLRHLVVREWRSSETGTIAAANPEKRQRLRLIADHPRMRVFQDPLDTSVWILRVVWRDEDRLKHRYALFIQRGSPDEITLMHGNVVLAYQGAQTEVTFRPPGARLDPDDRAAGRFFRSYSRSGSAVRAPLPRDRPVLYRVTEATRPAETSLGLVADPDQRPFAEEHGPAGVRRFEEVIDLVHSDDNDRHFRVETDEHRRSTLVFGDGDNGTSIVPDAEIIARYFSGEGPDGNVGRDALTRASDPSVLSAWNAFDVTDGRGAEPIDRVRRAAPEAYRAIQDRAITLRDYVGRAEAVPGVAKAAATYGWAGSWRTVRVVIDPKAVSLTQESQAWAELSDAVYRRLDAMRLILDDVEIRPPRYVPLIVRVTICLRPDVWPEQIRFVLERELSAHYTSDGRPGLFHPDAWTFGQALHASHITGRVQAVPGVAHVASVFMDRMQAPTTTGLGERVEVAADEIILVENDPSHMERGLLELVLEGGRR